MTDKEFKRLSRSQLIEIIYQFQLKQDELMAENERLANALEDKRLRIAQAGNIAEAALAVNNVMQSAQNAAQQYLDEIRTMYSELDEECHDIRKKAHEEAAVIIARAQQEAAAILAQAQKKSAPVKAPQKEVAPKSQTVKKEAPQKKVEKKAPVRTSPRRDDAALLEEILYEFGTLSER